jgi:hypothetical protein
MPLPRNESAIVSALPTAMMAPSSTATQASRIGGAEIGSTQAAR